MFFSDNDLDVLHRLIVFSFFCRPFSVDDCFLDRWVWVNGLLDRICAVVCTSSHGKLPIYRWFTY